MVTVSEPGLYSLILRSRKPQAKAFKRWITHDVIPSIRRTGSYAAPAAAPVQMLPDIASPGASDCRAPSSRVREEPWSGFFGGRRNEPQHDQVLSMMGRQM